MSEPDYMEVIKAMTNDELIAYTQTAGEDLTEAANTQNNSPWHEACFAACVVLSQEMGRRGIRLPGAPSIH